MTRRARRCSSSGMDAQTQTVMDGFARDLDLIEKSIPMLESYSRIDPEIIEHDQSGHRFRTILYHRESKAWFGEGSTDWSLHHCRNANFLQSDDIVVDLGCNAGFLTTWFAMECPRGHVHAFDPYPWNTASTRASAALNGLSNVTTYTVGIGDLDRTIEVPVYSSKTFNADALNGGPTLSLAIWSAERLREIQPTFAKIDIEGAEHELARSAFPGIASLRRGYVEMHPPFIEAGGGDPVEFLEALKRSGFSVAAERPYGPAIPHPGEYAVAPTAYYFDRI